MTTLYALLRDRCGLSIREAAEFHRASANTVTKWSNGDRNAPPGAIEELRTLYEQIEIAADRVAEMTEEIPPDDVVELCVVSDDHEAQSLGWPCVGAQAAAMGLAAITIANPVRVVGYGAAQATAAAGDAHDRARRDPKRRP